MIWAALPEELRSITRPIAARDLTGPKRRSHSGSPPRARINAMYVDASKEDEDQLVP